MKKIDMDLTGCENLFCAYHVLSVLEERTGIPMAFLRLARTTSSGEQNILEVWDSIVEDYRRAHKENEYLLQNQNQSERGQGVTVTGDREKNGELIVDFHVIVLPIQDAVF